MGDKDSETARPLNILQTIGNGCAFLDYDNSGNLSVLLVGESWPCTRATGTATSPT